MTQSLYDIERMRIAYWVAVCIGIALGILVAAIYYRLRRRAPIVGNFYRCHHCRWVYFQSPDGKWSSAVLDENNEAFPYAELDRYNDFEFQYLYGDCYGNLKKVRSSRVRAQA